MVPENNAEADNSAFLATIMPSVDTGDQALGGEDSALDVSPP